MNTRATAIVVVSAVLASLAIIAVMFRFWAQHPTQVHYRLDDFLIGASLVLTVGVCINNIVGATVARLGEHEIFQNSGPEVGFPYAWELRPYGQVMFSLQILHLCTMPLIKAYMLVFYRRIFRSRGFKIAVWVIGLYILCWWIAVLFVTIFQCNPISYNWATSETAVGKCIDGLLFYKVSALLNVLSDVAIVALPCPLVLALQMPKRIKLAVLLIFITGALVIVAGIGRTVSYWNDSDSDADFTYHDYYLVIWTSVEPCLGVIGACMPAMRPLFAGFSPQSVINSIRSALSLQSLGSRNGRDQRPENEDSQNLRQELPDDSNIVGIHHELPEVGSAKTIPSEKVQVEQNFGNGDVNIV